MSIALALTVVAALGQPEGPQTYEGRPIAQVMSWRGADWLERPDRAAEEATDRMLKRLRVKPGHTVVDLGCGSGFHARRLARLVGEQGQVICVDLQPEMLEIARRLASAEGLDNLRFVRGEPSRVPVVAGSVDVLLMVDVYHELAEPGPMLASIRASLKPTGRVALVEYRLEGATAAHIKRDHRMSTLQVRKEWEPAGFSLAGHFERLPSQHLFLFALSSPR
ncbi:MAG: methyltransferase domain-containing protein [Myxococcales bacterium]|nr:methyltransferase domain-containing protein [Myxococcales bacterium]